MNISLLWLLLIPLVLSILSVLWLPKLSRGSMARSDAALFALLGFVLCACVMSLIFYLAKGSQTLDVETLNGYITNKERSHGSYEESYSCNCRRKKVCTGSGKNKSCSDTEECDTCYRTHYTVTWDAYSTLGNYRIDKLDRTSRLVYQSPDPEDYTRIRIGEPCSDTHMYTNYVQAVPESLFRPASETLKAQFKDMIPSYPQKIYDRWKINRVLPVRVNVQNLQEWNDRLSENLKTLGKTKQVNAIIVLVNTSDSNYEYALRDAWISGKKNDVVLIIGATNFPSRAEWVRVLAWTDNALFKIKLQDNIMALDNLNAENVIGVLSSDISLHYKRKSMKDYAYLDNEIEAPLWLNLTMGLIVLLLYVGFWYGLYREAVPFKKFQRSFFVNFKGR